MEVFLEEELLYSTFRGNEYDANGFLLSAREELERIHTERENDLLYRSVRLSLPDDYLGKTLYITTYFPENPEYLYPVYPFLGNDDSQFSVMYVEENPEIVMLTFYAFFALIIAVIFLIDIPNSRADWRILLLSLYFLLLFLNKAFYSGPAYFSQFLPSYMVWKRFGREKDLHPIRTKSDGSSVSLPSSLFAG